MTDHAFERRLRDALAARAPGAASPSLRDRVAGVVALPAPRRSMPGAAVRVVGAAGVLLAAVLLVALVLRTGTPFPAGPGTSAMPSTGPGLHPGDGLVSPAFNLESWLLLGVVLGGILSLARRLWLSKRLPTRAWLIIVVLLLVGALTVGRLSTAIGLSDQGSHGPGLGYIGGQAPGLPETLDVYRPGPGQPITFAVVIMNDGVIPLTVRGLARPTVPTFSVAMVGLGTPDPPGRWTGAMAIDPTLVRPFQPFVVWPGDEVSLTVLAKTGSCVAGPDQPTVGNLILDDIPLVVGFLGYEWEDDVKIDQEVGVAEISDCHAGDELTIP